MTVCERAQTHAVNPGRGGTQFKPRHGSLSPKEVLLLRLYTTLVPQGFPGRMGLDWHKRCLRQKETFNWLQRRLSETNEPRGLPGNSSGASRRATRTGARA